MASCNYLRPGMSPAESGILKNGRHSTPKKAMTAAARSPIYLSQWLTHKLIKRYLEAFSDESWPAVVKWTFVLGVLALRNGGFPCHRLSLEDLKEIAKQSRDSVSEDLRPTAQLNLSVVSPSLSAYSSMIHGENSDDFLPSSMRDGLLQLVWCRDGSSSSSTGKENTGGTLALRGVDPAAVEAAAEREARLPAAATRRSLAGAGGAKAAAADGAKTAAAAGNAAARITTSESSQVKCRGGPERKGAAAAAGHRGGRGADIDEEMTVASRRVLSSLPCPRRSSRRCFSAEESRRPGPSAAEQTQQQQHGCCILQKPSSSWRSGDPITFTPHRGPYRGEQLPRPQRFSSHSERTYPVWWGDFFTSKAEDAPPLSAAAAAQGCCHSSLRISSAAGAQSCEKKVLLPCATPTRRPCEEAFNYTLKADISLSSPSLQQQQKQGQQQLEKPTQEQHRQGDCRLQICTEDQALPTLCVRGHLSKEDLQQQEVFEETAEDDEMTTAATALATPKFGAPAPAVAASGACDAAALTKKRSPHSKANSICCAGVACARSGEGKERPLLPKRCPSYPTLASPLSVAALLQGGNNQVEQQQVQQQPCDQVQHQSPGEPSQLQIRTCDKQQLPHCRRRYAPLSGPQQQRRLKQRALHRSVAATPHVVVDGFQSFRPPGEARWVCTLRPAAHRHVRPQPPVVTASTRRQPFLPPLSLQTPAAVRSSSERRGMYTGRRPLKQQQHYVENKEVSLHAHYTERAGVHSCSFTIPIVQGQKTDLLTIGECPRNTAPPQRLGGPLRGMLRSNESQSLTGRGAAESAREPQRRGGCLAAAVGVARAAARDAAFSAAAVAAAEKPHTMRCTLLEKQQSSVKQAEHKAPLLRHSNSSSNRCNYSSFFDAALAAYTNGATADTSESPHDSLLEPQHKPPPHRLPASVCPADEPCATSDDYSHGDDMIAAPKGLHAPEQQPVVPEFATSDAPQSSSNRRCSTSESSFSLSSLSVAEQAAVVFPDLQTTCAYPASAAAEEQHERCTRQFPQLQNHVDKEQRMLGQMQLPSQRLGPKQQPFQMQQVLKGGENGGHGETHVAGGPSVRRAAAENPGLEFGGSNTEDEAVTVKELVQLCFPTDMEKSSVLQQHHSCAVPLRVDAGWKRANLLQQSF